MSMKWEQLGTQTAERRKREDIATRRKGRRRAAAWRRACEQRDKQEFEELRLLREAKERAKLQEQQVLASKAEMRDTRWRMVMNRLNEDTDLGVSRRSADNDKRIESLREAKVLQKRKDRKNLRHEGHKAFFDSMPLDRRKLLAEVFFLYDTDGSGSLQAKELGECLREMGFRGYDTEERHAVANICEESVAGNKIGDDEGTVDMYELAAEVIPDVCKHLNRLRKGTFQETLSSIDLEPDGTYNFDQVIDAVRELWPFEFNADEIASHHDDDFGLQLEGAVKKFISEQIGIGEFFHVLGRIAEDIHWFNFARQMGMKAEHGLDDETFRDFRNDLFHLENTFRAVDVDQSGLLDREETTRLMKQIGLIPKYASDEMSRVFGGDDVNVTFRNFLSLIRKSRSVLEGRLYRKLKAIYPPWMADELSTVTPKFLNETLLRELNSAPRSRKELRAVSRVIREADQDGDDAYTLDECMHICRKTEETLRQMRLQDESDTARAVGFSENELNEARWAFDELDADHSGALDKVETKKAVSLLGGGDSDKFTNKQFAIAFDRLDADRSGNLELPEFLRLLALMRNPAALEEGFENSGGYDGGTSQTAAPPKRASFINKMAKSFDLLGPDQ
jgi:Ca2+-binding EF-hand superfamily protein